MIASAAQSRAFAAGMSRMFRDRLFAHHEDQVAPMYPADLAAVMASHADRIGRDPCPAAMRSPIGNVRHRSHRGQ